MVAKITVMYVTHCHVRYTCKETSSSPRLPSGTGSAAGTPGLGTGSKQKELREYH